MKRTTKHKIKILSFKSAGIAFSIGIPAWAILEKFPLWKENTGIGKTIGIGTFLVGVMMLITFKKTVYNYMKEKVGGKSAPPVMIWVVLLGISFLISGINSILVENRAILVAGAIGSGIGWILNFISTMIEQEKKEEADKDNAVKQEKEGL